MFRQSILGLLLVTSPISAGGTYFATTYAPSTKQGELPYGVTYTLWLPDNITTIRGVIVHQHGCGSGACKGGATAAYDLHWQALARKWNCALLGPSYHQEDGQDCRKWCDPRNGSEQAFLRCLKDFAKTTKHPELETAPWCLWGHSGGGFWASLMQTKFPERIIAIWFRSGTAFSTWEKGEIPKPTIPDAAYQIPIMLNPGAKEQGDKRFAGAWNGSMAMFKAYRKNGAPAGFAPDPQTSHDCGDSRYLAISFFDACLALRLPATGTTLKPIPLNHGWAAKLLSTDIMPVPMSQSVPEETSWLPNETVAKAWRQYVLTGATEDTTAPPAPFQVHVKIENGMAILTWDCEADLDSGLKGFEIMRNGKTIATLPEKPIGRYGRALFQTMSYHDTPVKPLPEMKYVDRTPEENAQYRVIAINTVGLKSEPSKPATAK